MKKLLALAAGLLTCASLMLAATPALARSDVSVGINIGVPGIYPAPIYMAPQPVYVEPRPVYVQPRVIYTQPSPLYIEGGPGYYREEYRDHWKHRHHKHDRDERNWRD